MSDYSKEAWKRLAVAAMIALAVCAAGMIISWQLRAHLDKGGEPDPLLMLSLIPLAIIGFVVTLPWSIFLGALDKTWPISLSINVFIIISIIGLRRLKRSY